MKAEKEKLKANRLQAPCIPQERFALVQEAVELRRDLARFRMLVDLMEHDDVPEEFREAIGNGAVDADLRNEQVTRHIRASIGQQFRERFGVSGLPPDELEKRVEDAVKRVEHQELREMREFLGQQRILTAARASEKKPSWILSRVYGVLSLLDLEERRKRREAPPLVPGEREALPLLQEAADLRAYHDGLQSGSRAVYGSPGDPDSKTGRQRRDEELSVVKDAVQARMTSAADTIFIADTDMRFPHEGWTEVTGGIFDAVSQQRQRTVPTWANCLRIMRSWLGTR